MIRLDALKAATEDFLAASLVGDGYEDALLRIGEAADRSAVVLSLDDGVNMKASMQTADVAAGVLAFAAGKSPPNPRTLRCTPGLREGFRTDQDDFGWEEIARSPWYQEFLRPHGVFWNATASLLRGDGAAGVYLSFKRGFKAGPCSALFTGTAPQSRRRQSILEQPMPQPDGNPSRPVPRRLTLVGGAFVLLAIAVAAYGLGTRAAQNARLHDLTEAQAAPVVALVTPASVKNDAGLDLPGRLQAYIQAPIYARVPGYLKSWKHDIGDKVKAGDVLAEIDTPDLDQQLMQARADLSVAQANAKLAQISAERWQSLASTDAVAKQDVDTRTFTWNANIAQVKSAQANVDHLAAEEGFKRLVAPFDGIVTARATDIGALINVGAAGGAQLFVVSETGKLRVYVNVPQNYVPSVPPGTQATISVPEHPGKTYRGTVEASAQAVDPTTRHHPDADHRRQ